MDPPPKIEQLLNTYVLERAVWQLATPFVLNLGDLPSVLVVEDVDTGLDSLLLLDTFGDVTSLQVHANRVTRTDNFVVQSLDLGESGLKTILRPLYQWRPCVHGRASPYPLGLKLFASSGNGDIILKDTVVIPKREFLQ